MAETKRFGGDITTKVLLSIVAIMFGVIIQQTVSLRQEISAIHDVQIEERTLRTTNSQVLLDHEGRLRIMETDQNRHQQEIKDWADLRFVRK